MRASEEIISVSNVVTKFGEQVVHNGVSFSVKRGEIVGIIGGSGSGKSVLLREIIGLIRPQGGEINVFGQPVLTASSVQLQEMRRRYGVMFQNGALFSALSVAENIAVPLVEDGRISPTLIPEIVELRLQLAGLESAAGRKLPAQLSGGMRKRAALARCLAMEPELIFLDEPTSGLDPVNARAFDKLIRTLSNSLGLTVFLVTHDLDTLFGIVDHLVVLGEGQVLTEGAVNTVRGFQHPWVQEYFSANEREL
jgi:phospholipid/cholesterol/gamma-HCH transport system ATP-binding protein